MSNQQTETKQMKNTTRHEGATAPSSVTMIGSINREGYIRYIERDCPKGHKTVWSVDDDGFMMYKYEPNWREEEEEEEDCIKVPDYDKHKLDKNCYICAVGHMKQKTPDSLYSQLTELTNGKYVCDGDECFNMMMELVTDGDKEQYKKICDEEECDTILDIDTPIMCYMNEERGDKTLCQECYEDGDYKKDDENSDNEDEEEDYKYVKQYLKCSDEDLTDLIQTQYLEL